MLCISETLGEVKGRYFLLGSVLLFLLQEQNPDVTWEKRGWGRKKSKTFVVSPGKWTSSTPSLGRQPRPGLRRAWQGREPGRVGPASPREPAQRAASLRLRAAFANSTLPGLPGADLLGLWGPEQKGRSFKILGRSGGLA